jgi:hypothetical protein
MDDDTTVLSQPETEQETQGTVQSDYASFLGPPSQQPDLSADERPAPDAEPAGAEGEPEISGEPEAEEGAEPEAQPEPEVEPEPEAEQPPSVEERLKDLTQRDLEAYGQRYPNAIKALQDPKTPEDLKHLLLDKIDGDREIQRRIAAEQELSEQEEPTLEEAEALPQTAVPQTVTDPAQARTAYYAQIDNLVKTGFDQQSVKEVGDTLLRMFNVNVKALDDPNVSPEDKAVLRGLVDSVQKEAPVLSRYMADAVSTVIPHVLPAAMELAYPGHSEMYERQVYGSAWETVRAQTDPQTGKPVFAGLPAFPAFSGTPESDAFSEKLREAAAQIPGFDDMVFRDRSGRVLPMREQAQMKYTLLAKTLSGQRVNPALVAEAVATGKRLAGKTDQRRQASRVTGAGQPTAHPVTQGQSDEDDPLMANLDAYIATQEQDYAQPIRGRRNGR